MLIEKIKKFIKIAKEKNIPIAFIFRKKDIYYKFGYSKDIKKLVKEKNGILGFIYDSKHNIISEYYATLKADIVEDILKIFH